MTSDADGWLAPFLPAMRARGARVLEVGCGRGRDAAWLSTHGFEVVAFDRRPLVAARAAAPAASFLRADIRRPLPLRDGVFDVAVASLSLHYFSWAVTLAAFAEVRRVLGPEGVFVFRVNATDDFAHGAGEGIELEPHFHRTERSAWAETKRFFDDEMVRAVVAGTFELFHLEHQTLKGEYAGKRVWQALARRA